MEELIELIKKAEVKYSDLLISVRVFSDGSCVLLRSCIDTISKSEIREFNDLDELRTHLNE